VAFIHQNLAAGRWNTFSLAEQLGNIGSEVSRAARAEGKDDERFWSAVSRALELFDLTLLDPRWRGREREIARSREFFCDAVLGGKEYGASLVNLMPYFDSFALVARK
jgi:hypothetical protein